MTIAELTVIKGPIPELEDMRSPFQAENFRNGDLSLVMLVIGGNVPARVVSQADEDLGSAVSVSGGIAMKSWMSALLLWKIEVIRC